MARSTVVAVGGIIISQIGFSKFVATYSELSNVQLRPERIRIHLSPDEKIDGALALILSPVNIISTVRFYKSWYSEIICFTNGEIIDQKLTVKLKKMGVKINCGKFVQINETPQYLNVTTTSKSEKVALIIVPELT